MTANAVRKSNFENVPLCENCSAHCRSAFQKLNSDHSLMIDAIRELKIVEAGQRIDPTADGSENFFCIYKGHVKVELGSGSNQKSIRICGPGDLVGLQMTEAYKIRSLDQVIICMIDAYAFRELQTKVPEISIGLVENLLKTISVEDERLRGLENHSVKNRIATTLLLIARKFGKTDQQGTMIDIAIDRKTLAQLSGTVTESLARILTELEDDQIIRRHGRKLQIINTTKLQEISEI